MLRLRRLLTRCPYCAAWDLRASSHLARHHDAAHGCTHGAAPCPYAKD